MEHNNEYLQAGYLFCKMSADIEAGRHFNKEADLAAIYKWLQNIYQNIMKYFDFGGAGMKALQQPKPAVPSYSPEQEAAAKIGVEKMMRGEETPAMFLSADELAARKAQESARKVDWADPFGLKKSEMDILGSPADIKKEFAEMRVGEKARVAAATAAAERLENKKYIKKLEEFKSRDPNPFFGFLDVIRDRDEEGRPVSAIKGPSSAQAARQQAIEAKTLLNRAKKYRFPEVTNSLPIKPRQFSSAQQQAIGAKTLSNRAKRY